MSFTSTPLGQQRRLDHQTFLGKHNHSQSQSRSSPRKNPETDFTQDNALARFARIKEQQQLDQPQRGRGPQIITSPPHSPEKWAQKDTSVLIASAFHQAVEDSFPSSSAENMNISRSTSVDYEKETEHTSTRRYGPPPPSGRARPPNSSSNIPRKPLSTANGLAVPPVNGASFEESIDLSTGRARSPLLQMALDTAAQGINQVAYYVRQRSTEPNTSNSYDYSQEEREVQERAKPFKAPIAHKKGVLSFDNKAYKPESDDEDEDYHSGDDRRKRRKKKGKELAGGPLTSLPQLQADKRRKKVTRKRRDGTLEEVHEDDAAVASGSDSYIARRLPSMPPPDPLDDLQGGADSLMENTLDSILEEEPAPRMPSPSPTPRRRSRSRSRTREKAPFSIGAWLGTLARPFVFILSLSVRTLSALMDLAGRLLGMIFGIIFARPYTWFHRSTIPFATIFVSAIALLFVATVLRNSPSIPIPSLPSVDWAAFIPVRSSAGFEGVPPDTVKELINRLHTLEKAVVSLPDSSGSRSDDLISRLSVLEGRVKREADRAKQAEEKVGSDLKSSVSTLRTDLETIVRRQDSIPPPAPAPPSEAMSAEEKLHIKKLEEKLSDFESSLSKVVATEAKNQGSWWNKVSTGKSSDLKIKAADGTDVSKLIERLVQDSIASDHGFHQADYAAFSAGARVIPSLTSDTFTVSPPTLPLKFLGFLTGSGSATALPPVTALHHDVQNGRCWAMPGQRGQLGIALARGNIQPSGFVVEHVRAELATDKDADGGGRKSAPREMEAWGLVEGKENIKRVNEWRKASSASQEIAQIDPPPPKGLSRGFMRLANFTYELEDGIPSSQFFEADEHIKMLGLDFGVIVFRIMGNHGRKEWTCLYRVRVFGDVATAS